MNTVQKTKERYKLQEDGSYKLTSTETIDVEVPTTEEIIADKEAEMLAMYNEIKKLKEEN